MQAMVTLIAITLRLVSIVSCRLAGRFAWFLFRQPVGRAKVRPDEQDIHDRAKTETIDVDGAEVVVYRWGDAPGPVLLVHGWEGRASRYAALVRELTDDGLSAIAFDAPGHGASPGKTTQILQYAAIIHRLFDQHGPFRAIIAHSFGVLGTFQALRAGVRAARVVSVNGVCDFGYLADKFSDQLSLTSKVSRYIRRRSEEVLASGDDIWERFSVSYQPAAVRAPILVIQDDDDPTVDPEQARRIAAAYRPNARLMTTQRLGHHRALRTPRVIETIVDFVGGRA